jgi:hypothetical protein
MASDAPVYDLSEPNLWQKPWFQEKLLASLARDGHEPAAIEAVRAVLREAAPATLEAFKAAAAERLPSLPAAAAAGLERAAKHLDAVAAFNRSIYFPQTPDEIKRRFWPNNPKLLATNWHSYADIFEADFHVATNRFIKADTAIGSAGSCFAAAISRQLQLWGYNYVLEMGKKPDDPNDPDAYEPDPARCGTIYSAPVMRQMVERAFGEWIPEKIVLRSEPKFIDPFRGFPHYSDWAGYHADYDAHNRALRRALERCDVFIITLGMTEAWYFADNGKFTNTTPRGKEHTLFRCKNLTVAENLAELETLYAVYKRHKPGIKFIVTVSPVPINATFNLDRHVVVANSLSKSTLRVAAEEFCRRHAEDAFYFPSYEIVLYGSKEPWEIDRRHVTPSAVERVMQQFQRMFMVDQSPMPILGDRRVADLFPQKRNYALYWARRIVRPIKRKLGIEGRGFGEVARKWVRRKVDRLHPPLPEQRPD